MKKDVEQAKILLMRLNYIMASLDGHDAYKETENNREEASKDKNKRIWELW